MSDPFIGEIRGWGMIWPPRGWAYCNGEKASISQYQALYALIGDIYGPVVQNQTFTLPDLRGVSPMSAGNPAAVWVAQGLPPAIKAGQKLGSSSVQLNYSQMAAHTHQAVGATAPYAGMTSTPSATNYVSRPLGPPSPPKFPTGASFSAWQNAGTPDQTMAANMIGGTGGGQPHENRQPYLTFNFCIALEGIWPSRN